MLARLALLREIRNAWAGATRDDAVENSSLSPAGKGYGKFFSLTPGFPTRGEGEHLEARTTRLRAWLLRTFLPVRIQQAVGNLDGERET